MGNVWVNISSNLNPNPATSDCYIQACRILAGSCSGISTVSRVRVIVKVTVRVQCVKGLMWYHGMDVVYLAEYQNLSAVDIAQLAHTANECILS